MVERIGIAQGRAGKQVAGQLFDRKLIERHVGIQSANYPITIRPKRAQIVTLKTMRVRISGRIQPGTCPTFAKFWPCEQSIDRVLISLRARVGEKLIEFRRRRRQPGEIERDASQ